MAITWRNVESNLGFRDAGMLMRTAQDSFNASTSSLADIFKQYQQTNDYNHGVQKENNTNAYLDRVNSYRTPEELEAARKSGELDQFRQQFGGFIDSSKIRGAEDTRLQTLQDTLLRNNEVEDSVRTRNERGIKDELVSAIYRGDEGKYRQLKDSHELLNEGELDKLWSEAARQRAQDERATRQDQRAQIQLGMQQTRFGWESAEQDRLAAERKSADALGRRAMQVNSEINQQEEANWAIIQREAANSGLPLGEDGLPKFSSPEEAGAFNQRLKEAGVVPVNRSALINQTLDDLLSSDESSGIKPAQLANFRNQLTELMEVSSKLAPEDQARVETGTANLTETFSTRMKDLEAQHQKEIAANPYMQNPTSVEEGVIEALGALPKDFDPMGVNASQREMLIEAVESQIRDGMPPAVAKLIVAKVGGSYGLTDDIDDFFNQEAARLKKEGIMESGMKDAESMRARHEEERTALTSELNQSILKLKAAARSRGGLAPANSVDYVQGLTSYGRAK